MSVASLLCLHLASPSLGLNFSTCKMGIIIRTPLPGSCEMGDNSGRAGPRRSQQLQTVFRYDYVLSRYQSSLWVSLSLLPLEACLEDSDVEGCAGARASLSHCPHHCWGVALPWDIARGHNLPPNSTNSFTKLEPQVCHRWLGRPVTLRIWCVCPLPDSLALLSLRLGSLDLHSLFSRVLLLSLPAL